MKKLLLLVSLIFLTSCSSLQFRYGTLNAVSTYDGIYYNKNSKVEVIENEFEFQRKLQWDDEFRWNFSQFAQNQPLSWYYRNFNQLGGWRSPYTPFDIYWNRHLFWSNWSFNYGFTYGYGWNRGILGLNNWGSWNYPYWGRPYNYGYGWRWNNRIDNRYWIERNRRNQIANNRVYVRGRRGSNNQEIRTPLRTRTNSTNRVILNKEVDNRVINRVNVGRRNIPTPNTNRVRVYQRQQPRTPQRVTPTRRTQPQVRQVPQRRTIQRPTQTRTNVGRRSIKQ